MRFSNLPILLIFLCANICSAQSHYTLPADSAVWRYRMYDPGPLFFVTDAIFFTNGTDTNHNGHTYRKVMARAFTRIVPQDSMPPVAPVVASYPDAYYGAFREESLKVFWLTLHGEDLIYDYNAVIGDSIPAYAGKKKVISVDSIDINGSYRRRWITTDTAFSVIEGVGNSQGLLPQINDGTGLTQFFCFTHVAEVYAPISVQQCTYVYQIGTPANVPASEMAPLVDIYPVPVTNFLNIAISWPRPVQIIIFDITGKNIWSGAAIRKAEIPVITWKKGIYLIIVKPIGAPMIARHIVIE